MNLEHALFVLQKEKSHLVSRLLDLVEAEEEGAEINKQLEKLISDQIESLEFCIEIIKTYNN